MFKLGAGEGQSPSPLLQYLYRLFRYLKTGWHRICNRIFVTFL